MAASFDVDPEVEKKVLRARTHEAIIMTRPDKSTTLSLGNVEKAASDFFQDAVKQFFEI